METLKVIKTDTRLKFGPNGCLRFPEILMRFNLDRELDPEVTAHLRSCPRCWKLFDSVVHADAGLVRETMSETKAPGGRCAELEDLLYDDMFAGVRDNDRVWRIYNLSRNLNRDERAYLLKYLNFLSYSSATAAERAELLEGILNGETLVFFKKDGEAVPYLIKKRIYADRDRLAARDKTQIAAGDSDSDFAKRTAPLSNGWECEITYMGGGRDTELKLTCDSADPPVLGYCAVSDVPAETPKTFNELQYYSIMGGKPVYRLDGTQSAEILIPGAPESLTVYTISHVKTEESSR